MTPAPAAQPGGMEKHVKAPATALALLLCAMASLAHAQPAPPSADQLAPPVERVLNQLSLDAATRTQLRELLLRQRAERQQADAQMRQRHRAEPAALLTQDQLAALDAARPPPPGHRRPPSESPR